MMIRSLVACWFMVWTVAAFAQRSTPVQFVEPVGSPQDFFSYASAIDGDTLVVGIPADDVGSNADQGTARVYRWAGNSWVLEATLTGVGGGAGEFFGDAVAISGDTVAVGAPIASVNGNTSQGAAYVFTRSGTSWTQQARLVNSAGGANDTLGWSIALSGDTLVAGARGDTVGTNTSQGSASVFVRRGTAWTHEAVITASDGAGGDSFGTSVALREDTLVIGADGDDFGAFTDQGSAYVFTRSAAIWSQQAKLTAPAGASFDTFGTSVGIWGDTAIVGAPGDDVGATSNQGSAFVFVRSGSAWALQSHLNSSEDSTSGAFGASVAINGSTCIVGAPGDNLGGGALQGSAHVFARNGAAWTRQAQLTVQGSVAGDRIGQVVALSDDAAIVGSPFDDVGSNINQGSFTVFSRVGSTWIGTDMTLIPQSGAANDQFGAAVSISGDTAIVGVPEDDVGASLNQGSAFIFVRVGARWIQQAQLLAADGAANDRFGSSVAIHGETAVVGSPSDDVGALGNAGSVYVFVRTGTAWAQQAQLNRTSPAISDAFGGAVAIFGDTVIAGGDGVAIGADLNRGAASVFVRSGVIWSHQAQLIASDGATQDRFGNAVAISGDTAVVGASFDDIGSDLERGSAYVFERLGTTWQETAHLSAPDGRSGDRFGWSVGVSGTTAVVSTPFQDQQPDDDRGAVHVFTKNGVTWAPQAKLSIADGVLGDNFGSAVAITGDTLVAGATQADIGTVAGQGALYAFTRNATTWSSPIRLTATDGAGADNLGGSVAISGDLVITGAPLDDAPANNQGSVRTFDVSSMDIPWTWNNSAGTGYPTLSDALLHATSGQELTATEAAWRSTSSLNTLGRSLALRGIGDIRTNPTCTVELGGSSVLAAPVSSVVDIGGQLRVASGGSADVQGAAFRLDARGTLTVRTGASLSVNSPTIELQGQTRLEQGASLTLEGGATAFGSTTANTDSALTVTGTFTNVDTLTVISSTINVPLLLNRSQTNVFGSSAIFGDFNNHYGAATTIRSGTLFVFGDLTNNGTIIGTICAGCVGTPPNMDIGGTLGLGGAASLSMPFPDSLVRVGGNFDCAITSNTRFDMSLATLQLEGGGSEQTLEVMSLDIGADLAGLDRNQPGHYPIRTLHIGVSPSTVRLVDAHDNDGAGQGACEAIYVDTLRIDAGSRLINTNCRIYYNELLNNGVIDVPANVISLQPTFCPADFNQDGGVDGDDVIGFFAAWDAGDIAADFNDDGGVDGDDVIGFFANWDAGC